MPSTSLYRKYSKSDTNTQMALKWNPVSSLSSLSHHQILLFCTILLLTTTHRCFAMFQSYESKSIDHGPSRPLRYFYSDQSMQQSVGFNLDDPNEEALMKIHLLDALGLDHQPKPKSYHVLDESASHYLIELYTQLASKQQLNMNFEQISPEVYDTIKKIQENGTTITTFTTSGSTFANGTKRTTEFKLESGREKRQISMDISEADVIMSFKNHVRKQRKNSILRHNRERRFWFNIIDMAKDKNMTILDADLRLYRDVAKSRLNSSFPIRLTLYMLVPNNNRNAKKAIRLQYIDSMTIPGNKGGWLQFNVTEPVHHWTTHSHDYNLGLYLQVRSDSMEKDLSPKMVGIINNNRGFRQYQPFMAAYLKLPANSGTRLMSSRRDTNTVTQSMQSLISRQRRAVHNGGKKSSTKRSSSFSFYESDKANPFIRQNERICAKHSLHVSFKALNWGDWIVTPDSYTAAFCDGQCNFPIPSNLEPTNHAILQNLMHLMSPNSIPKPCCAPKELSPIMVLYFDDDSNVVLKKFKNMVVTKCSCH